MNISAEEIKKLASLAKLHLEESAIPKLTVDLNNIFHHIEVLKTLDLGEVPETNAIHHQSTVLRADESSMTFAKEDMLPTMPRTDEAGNLIVNAVFQDSDETTHAV